MRKDEQGTILIEFVGSFLLFVLLIMSILSLVNIGTMQARMHYAMTQAATTLSMYGYVLNVIGVDEFLIGNNAKAEDVREGINNTINDINEVLANINKLDLPGVANSAGTVMINASGQVNSTFDNPKAAINNLANYALSQGMSFGFEQLLKPLIGYHLANGNMNGDEYLRSVGVDGVDSLVFYTFSLPGYVPPSEGELVGSISGLPADDSVLLNKDGNVRITVQYEMEYSFMGLNSILPFEPKLKVTQSVMTKMWLSGSGEGYKEKKRNE